MSLNATDPASTGIEARARKSDLAGSEIGFQTATPATTTQAESAPGNGQTESYGAYTIKRRQRRTKAAMTAIRDVMKAELEESHPQTNRQLFYALTVKNVITKIEAEYQRTVVRLLSEMRKAGLIPFPWIADNTRWQRKPSSFTGIEACLSSVANNYRRDLWISMPVYVEVWLEKDALAGVLVEETTVYDVPLMVARGYSSLSFLHSAGEAIKAKGKPAYIYHFGDHDPSGVDAARNIEANLRRFAPDIEIHFERVAVTPAQIAEWNLPTRPTKMKDPRAKKFGSATSVELDAIPATKLRELVRGCIERHVDQRQLSILKAAEESEREFLKSVAAIHGGGK